MNILFAQWVLVGGFSDDVEFPSQVTNIFSILLVDLYQVSNLFVDIFQVCDVIVHLSRDVRELASLNCLSCRCFLRKFAYLVDLLLMVQNLGLHFINLCYNLSQINLKLGNVLISLLMVLSCIAVLLHQDFDFIRYES